MRLPTVSILLTLLSALPAAAQQPKEDAAAFLRVPAAQEGEDRIHTIRARVRHTTVIVLPAGERILDFVAGDSEYWHLTGAANVAYLKPLAEDAATNIALVCESGGIRLVSFCERWGYGFGGVNSRCLTPAVCDLSRTPGDGFPGPS